MRDVAESLSKKIETKTIKKYMLSYNYKNVTIDPRYNIKNI